MRAPDNWRRVRRLRELCEHVAREVPITPASQVFNGLIREVAVRQEQRAALQHLGLAVVAARRIAGPHGADRGEPHGIGSFRVGQHIGSEGPAFLRREQDEAREEPTERGRTRIVPSGLSFSIRAKERGVGSAAGHTEEECEDAESLRGVLSLGDELSNLRGVDVLRGVEDVGVAVAGELEECVSRDGRDRSSRGA